MTFPRRPSFRNTLRPKFRRVNEKARTLSKVVFFSGASREPCHAFSAMGRIKVPTRLKPMLSSELVRIAKYCARGTSSIPTACSANPLRPNAEAEKIPQYPASHDERLRDEWFSSATGRGWQPTCAAWARDVSRIETSAPGESLGQLDGLAHAGPVDTIQTDALQQMVWPAELTCEIAQRPRKDARRKSDHRCYRA